MPFSKWSISHGQNRPVRISEVFRKAFLPSDSRSDRYFASSSIGLPSGDAFGIRFRLSSPQTVGWAFLFQSRVHAEIEGFNPQRDGSPNTDKPSVDRKHDRMSYSASEFPRQCFVPQSIRLTVSVLSGSRVGITHGSKCLPIQI
jgi:hypothetical protein